MIKELIDRIKPYTKSDWIRLSSMADALIAIDIEEISGDVVECGVWRGGNIMLARIISPSRKCWLYDTFDGMTIPDDILDVKRSGEKAIDRFNLKKSNGSKWDAVSVDQVHKHFEDVGLGSKELNFVVGPVEETLLKCVPEKIAILRLDVDWYLSTKICLEILYPKLSAGGFLIVDDYGHWMGCKKAVDDYFDKSVVPLLYHDVDYSCRVFIKC